MDDKPKHAGGRPLKFPTVELLQAAINEYFDHCDNRIRQVYSKKTDSVVEILDPEPYTMAGLAYALGLDRKSLVNYGNREEYFHTIKKARDKVQVDVERRLMEGQTVGAIFNLKNNFDYKDKIEADITSNGETLNSATPVDDDLRAEWTEFLKNKTKQ